MCRFLGDQRRTVGCIGKRHDQREIESRSARRVSIYLAAFRTAKANADRVALDSGTTFSTSSSVSLTPRFRV